MTTKEKNFVLYTLGRILNYSRKIEDFAQLRRTHVHELKEFCGVRNADVDFSKLGNIVVTEEFKNLSEEVLAELQESIEFQVDNWLI